MCTSKDISRQFMQGGKCMLSLFHLAVAFCLAANILTALLKMLFKKKKNMQVWDSEDTV